MADEKEIKLVHIADRLAKSGKAGEVLFQIESTDLSFSWTYGNSEKPFFIASATKLFVLAILAKLRDTGRLDWDFPIKKYLPDLDLSGLHLFRGADYTEQITIRHLLAHTSGLPDYFEGKRSDGAPLFQKVMKQDQGWSLNDVVQWSRKLQSPHFPPGSIKLAFHFFSFGIWLGNHAI